jgi:hypothetical protein
MSIKKRIAEVAVKFYGERYITHADYQRITGRPRTIATKTYSKKRYVLESYALKMFYKLENFTNKEYREALQLYSDRFGFRHEKYINVVEIEDMAKLLLLKNPERYPTQEDFLPRIIPESDEITLKYLSGIDNPVGIYEWLLYIYKIRRK